MKKLLLIIPILFFLNINELKVISYNIRYNNSNDGINIWENRRSTIKNFIIDEMSRQHKELIEDNQSLFLEVQRQRQVMESLVHSYNLEQLNEN